MHERQTVRRFTRSDFVHFEENAPRRLRELRRQTKSGRGYPVNDREHKDGTHNQRGHELHVASPPASADKPVVGFRSRLRT